MQVRVERRARLADHVERHDLARADVHDVVVPEVPLNFGLWHVRLAIPRRRIAGPHDTSQRDRATRRLARPSLPMTVTVTARGRAATAHAYCLPTVREIPPVLRPGMFDSTW
jgi:hypothetical protein